MPCSFVAPLSDNRAASLVLLHLLGSTPVTTMGAPAWGVQMTGPAAERGASQPSPWPAAGWEVDEALLNLAAWCSVAIVYTLLCYTLLPRHEFHGSPLYSWLSCLPVQFIGFPYVAFTALSSFPYGDRDAPLESVVNYMLAPWTMLDQTAERNFLLLMFSFMFKDAGLYLVGSEIDASYWVHHIISWFIQLHFFFTASQSQTRNQNGATSGFEMCFCYRTPAPLVPCPNDPNQNTSRIQFL